MSDLSGNISTNVNLKANLTPVLSLNGEVSSNSSLNGKITTSETLNGKISTNSNLNGSINVSNNLKGSLNIGDTSDANAEAGDLLEDKTAYVKGNKIIGTMPNNLPISVLLQTKEQTYTIPQGYHNGTATVSIDDTNINSANIKHDVSILGVTGNYAGDFDISDTTATANTVEKDKVFYSANGTRTLGTYEWNWKGSEPEFVQKFYDQTIALKNTGFDTWEASTTATAMKETENITTVTLDTANYEYLVRWKYSIDFVYNTGATLKAIPIRECADMWQEIIKRPSTLANLRNEVFNGNYCITLYTAPLLEYYTTKGADSFTYSISYGVYPSLTAHTFSNSTSDTPVLTLKTPQINARCYSSYFATARKTEIDSTNTKYHLVGELYRIPIGGTLRSIYENLIDTYNE